MSPTDQADNAAQHAGIESAGGQGLPTDLPDHVPEFVSELHAHINDAMAEGVDSLGQTISEITTNATVNEAAAVLSDISTILSL